MRAWLAIVVALGVWMAILAVLAHVPKPVYQPHETAVAGAVEPMFLGVAKPTWDLVNGFANWFAALGTFTAAGVALYIANKTTKPKAKLSVGHRIMIYPGERTKRHPAYVSFRIVNTGDRPLTINGIGWKVGRGKQARHAIQSFRQELSSPLPVQLMHGVEASWHVPLDAAVTTDDQNWCRSFAERMLMPNFEENLENLWGTAWTSTGHVFQARAEGLILTLLRAECESLRREEFARIARESA